MQPVKNRQKHRRSGKRGEFTSVDIAVLILVVVSLFGTVFGWVYQSVIDDRAQTHENDYVVSFRLEQTHRKVAEGLTPGDTVYTVSDGLPLGILRDDMVLHDAEDGTGIDRVIGTGSMVCSGVEDGGSLSVAGEVCHLTPGDTLRIRTEREYVTVFIVAITAE